MMEMDEKINKITEDMLTMFEITINFLKEASNVYLNNMVVNVSKINDDEIDRLERNIEEECLLIILKERPFASDLRKVSGIFKMVEDVERLGDHAEDLVWTTTNLLKYNENTKITTLKNMIKVALGMVEDSYKAFATNDDTLAKSVILKDDIVDSLYLEVLKELPIKKDGNNLKDDFIIYATLLTKYIERIADHASNIAEWVVYIKSGYYKDEVII